MSTQATTELPPRYDAAAVQAEVARVWDDERLFHAEPTDDGEPFCVVIPPPNVTAKLHLGHAFNNTIQDILVRHARMQGKNAVWIPGTDHAGIATQTVVEKRLLQTEGKRRTDYTRDEFVAKVQAWKDEYEQVILGQLKAMGCSCDYERTAFTMDEPRSEAVREAFFRLFKDGLIYRGKRLVNWDPATQTALADDEVENEEIDGHFYYLKYPLRAPTVREGSGASTEDPSLTVWARNETSFITVATTRPETMLGDTAIAINPKDPRAAELRGMKIVLPIVGREIPIVEDDYVVMPGDEDDPKAKFATGFLKVTPAHDPNDWDIGQRHDLEVLNIMAADASISDAHGWTPETVEARQFVGLSREAARERVVAWFKDNGLLEKVVPYRHSVGHSYRSHVPVEPYLSDQWYVAVQKPIPWMADAGTVEGTAVPANSLAGLALTALRSAHASEASPDREGGVPDELDASSADPEPLPHGRGSLETFSEIVTGDDVLRFVPERYAKTYTQWNAALRDWCISRQLWWGHRIPVWSKTVRIGDYINYPDGPLGEAHDTLRQLSVVTRETLSNGESYQNDYLDDAADNAHILWIKEKAADRADTELHLLATSASHHEDSGEMFSLASIDEQMSQSFGEQDPDVLDTWFSSALWPMSTLGWPNRTPELELWNPTSVLCTAREIITLWVSRMVMFNRYLLAHPDEQARNTDASPERERGVSDDLPEPLAYAQGSQGENKRNLPFRNVFIHAMIQDGHGQKMSKSLGNGVDPLDIIDSHGADAMRFTLAGMATHTQDVRLPVDSIDPHTGETFPPQTFTNASGYVVAKPIQEHNGKRSVSGYGLATGEATPSDDVPLARNTSSKFDLGRNFCNKLWNASRFVIGSLSRVGLSPPPDAAGTDADGGLKPTLLDRWILSRLVQTVEACDAALADYRFDRYTTALYDFFWRDFCDWYVESTKPRTKAEDPVAARVLATCLDVSLRLLHPAVPFATERLWWSLNEAAPDRGIGGITCPPSERCIMAPWPTDLPAADGAAIERIDQLRELVLAVRQLRADHKVEPRRVVPVAVRHDGSLDDLLADGKQAFETWASAELIEGDLADAATTKVGVAEICVGGIIDATADAARNEKEKAALTKKINALRGRLANKGYTDKAPPHLVQETRDQLSSAEAQLAAL
jgi:valyl-tRNA synthetase